MVINTRVALLFVYLQLSFVLKACGGGDSESSRNITTYSIVCTVTLLLCRNAGSGRELVTLKWGLIPPWELEPKTKLSTINAKTETCL